MVFKHLRRAFWILTAPNEAVSLFKKKTFEQSLGNYLNLMLSMGFLAGILSLIYDLLRSVYVNIVLTVNIDYWRLINYSLGKSVAIFFFYLFAGTIFFFIISLILNPFFRKLKYTRLLELMMFAVTPLLLFGWFPKAIIPLVIWSIFLFVTCYKNQDSSKHVKKGTILQRE